MRMGLGYDVHKLIEGRKLIIGGVEIPYEKGLLGHSDGDVLLHAIKDALLGAAALGDIGAHFPDTDIRYKDANSMDLLKEVGILLSNKGYNINNIDSTIMAEEPRMAQHLELMIERISEALNLSINQINIKATTMEGLGFVGEKKGIAAQAIASIDRK